MLFSTVLTGLALSSLVSATPVSDTSLAARVGNEVDTQGFKGARWTWYDVGLGACGKVSHPGDFVVALNPAQFGNGGHCFQKVKMSHKGKKATATIIDNCPGCPRGGLDLSKGLFKRFAPLAAGHIQGKWHFIKKGASTASNGTAGNTTETSDDVEIEIL